MLTAAGAGADVWVEVRGVACFGNWPEVGALTGGCRQVVGLWDLLRGGADEAVTEEGGRVGLRVCVEVTYVVV